MLQKLNPKALLARKYLPRLWRWYLQSNGADGATIIQNAEDPRATLAPTKKDRENHGIRCKLGELEDFYRTRGVGVKPMSLFGAPLWLAYNEGDGIASLPGARALKETHEEYRDVATWEELEALFDDTGEERIRGEYRADLPEDVVEILELALEDADLLTRQQIEHVDEVIPLPRPDASENGESKNGEKGGIRERLEYVAGEILSNGEEEEVDEPRTDGGHANVPAARQPANPDSVSEAARKRVMRDVKGEIEIPNKSVVNLEWLGFLPTHNGDRHDIHRAEQNAIISQWKQLAKQKGSEWVRYVVFMVLGAVVATQFGGGGGGLPIPLPF